MPESSGGGVGNSMVKRLTAESNRQQSTRRVSMSTDEDDMEAQPGSRWVGSTACDDMAVQHEVGTAGMDMGMGMGMSVLTWAWPWLPH